MDLCCPRCGNQAHFFDYHCPYNLHGKEDSFRTSCAGCGTVIPSGAPRQADNYGNLYCDLECKAEMLEELLDDVVGIGEGVTASA